MNYRSLVPILPLLLAAAPALQAAELIHDAEHYILKAQHAEQWAQDDVAVSAKLSGIRAANGGKPPNIVYILLDDLGFGEIGMPNMDVTRGYSTPSISGLADEGVSLMRMYTEPSCTPTRAAMLTGRYAMRTGFNEAKSLIEGVGLADWEKTLAEVLSETGYECIHIGKWHLGDIEESYAFNQGFDYAAHPLHQQGQMAIMNATAGDEGMSVGIMPHTRQTTFELDKTFRVNPNSMVYGIEGKKGGKAREVDFEAGEVYTQETYEKMETGYKDQAIAQIDRLAKGDKPFFLQFWPQFPLTFTRSSIDQAQTLNGGPIAEGIATVDGWIGEILDKIDETGIAENTIVLVMGDNGPFMQYVDKSGQSDRIYRGGKAQHLEGGVRVNAYMRWPAALEAGSRIQDMIHVTDLFTTFARIGNAHDKIPTDRLIDGVDQSAALLLGEGKGRRDYVFVYEGPTLKSIVKQQFKMHVPPPGSNPIAASIFDLYKNPREDRPQDSILYGVSYGAQFVNMLKRHMAMKMKYPDREPGLGIPYGGIENLRPESEQLVANMRAWMDPIMEAKKKAKATQK